MLGEEPYKARWATEERKTVNLVVAAPTVRGQAAFGALVGWQRDWLALGVDIEPDRPLDTDAADVILRPEERGALDAAGGLRHGRLLSSCQGAALLEVWIGIVGHWLFS